MIPTRRPNYTTDVGPFSVTVSFMPDKRANDMCGRPVEVFISRRAKTGTELDDHLYQIGVEASRLMHKRDE